MIRPLFEGIDSKWFDDYGWLSNKPNKRSDNGQLFTAEFICAKVRKEKPSPKEKEAWADEFRELMNPCREEPGLYRRHPGATLLNSIDNYIGIAAASKILGTGHAKSVLEWGRNSKWSWNDQDDDHGWTLRSFLGRNLGFITHLKWCAGEEPSGLEQWIARQSLDLSWTEGPKNTSNKCLSWLLSVSSEDHDFKLLYKELRDKDYPEGGTYEIFERYFPDNHPMLQYFKK